ncbi:TM2 domain-containing protein [Chryseobacterium gossypii]|uniref:TM2 domain-containing protein n=1 Tax=Chryseobacterium gossypii TaxID=3231602 RepID=UPI0035262772
MKSKFTTAMLALFLGGLGIHRFYLGQNITGIFYLLFCWTLIPSLIALIDFFIFIFMSEDSFNYKYNLRSGF